MSVAPTANDRVREIIKCGKDPVYFINNYVKIQHPTKGTLAFNTFPFQDDCLRDFMKHRFNIVVKSRQLGLSTVSAAYAVWLALFRKDKSILVIASKLATAVNFIKKVKFALKSLPQWLLIAQFRDTQQSVTFSNGSEIKAIPTSDDAGRSEALSLLIVDEAAIIRNFDEVWTGLYPTVSAGGAALLISTPKGVGGMYHKIYADAVAGINNFNAISLPWTVHPEHDEDWFKEDSKQFSGDKKRISQEYLCVGENSKIITPEGFKLAGDLQQGDLVLTAKGRFRPVIETHSRLIKADENLYRVSVPGCRKSKDIYVTGEHPIMAYRFDVPQQQSALDYVRDNFEKLEPSFIEADTIASKKAIKDKTICCLYPKFDKQNFADNEKIFDLASSDLVFEKTETICRYLKQWGSTKRYIPLDFDAGRFIGLYLAEGGIQSDGGFDLAFHINERNTLAKFCEDFLARFEIKSTVYEKGNACRVYSSNKFISYFFKNFTNGLRAGDKCLNMERILQANEQFAKGIIVGFYEGDGSHAHTIKANMTSISEKMIYQFKMLMSMWGHYPRIGKVEFENVNHSTRYYLEIDNISGEDIRDILSSHKVEKSGSRTRFIGNSMFVGNPSFELVTDEVNRSMKVIDIKVEEDKTFIVDSLVVHNCDFISSGDTYLQPELMDWLKSMIREPLVKEGDGRRVWVWEKPVYGHKYLISADVARGDATDYSTFHIIDTTTASIVVEYKGKVPPDRLAELIVIYARMYNNALVCPENNALGYMTCSKIKELKYTKLYYPNARHSENYIPKEGEVPGFNTQQNNKIQALTKLEELLRTRVLKSYSQRLADEFSTYVWNGAKAGALKGYNDDLVMSVAIGAWLLDVMYGGGIGSETLEAAMARSITISRKTYADVAPMVDAMKPITTSDGRTISKQTLYKMGNIDIDWLLK